MCVIVCDGVFVTDLTLSESGKNLKISVGGVE